MASEKGRENEREGRERRKMKETEKEAGELKASPKKKFYKKMKDRLYSAWPGAFYSQPLIQIGLVTSQATRARLGLGSEKARLGLSS